MARKFYTLDDLYDFCKENRFESFSAEKQGAPLVVQSFGTFEADDKNADGLMAVKLKSCHTGKNRNKSGITDDNMNKYKHTFKGRPILGAIYKTDTGEYEFHAHDMKVIDGGEDIEHIEQPIGVISQTEEPYLEFDEEEDKNYLMVSGTIFSDYSKAAEILERRRTCKCSVEIAVEELSYNCDEDYLSIDKFRFSGVTILGYEQDGVTEIQEGMKGSKITIDDFSVKNSMFSADCQDKLIETLEKLNMTLESFNNKNTTQKGGNEMKFEELLAKYGITAEEVTFEIEGLSDEELEAKFAEVFESTDGDNAGDGEGDGDNGEGDGANDDNSGDGEDGDDNDNGDDGDGEGDGDLGQQPDEKFILKYELSHDDIRSALYSLLAAESEDGYYYTWIVEVYDDKFIYQDYMEDKFYRQNYTKDGDNVTLGDNKVEVFNEWLSKSEREALDTLKADYAVLKDFKASTEAAQLQAQKDAIFAREEFADIIETKAFKKLVENSKDYTVEECEQKAKDILDDCNNYVANFAAKDETNKPKVLGFNIDTKKEKKKKAYGKLFD